METALTKDELESRARDINRRLHTIRDAERFAENQALAGKTFRFKNNYSCPEKPSDRWWLYAKVLKVDKTGHLTVMEFQTDKYGDITIRTDKFRFHMNDYQACPASVFNKAWRDLQRKIANTKP